MQWGCVLRGECTVVVAFLLHITLVAMLLGGRRGGTDTNRCSHARLHASKLGSSAHTHKHMHASTSGAVR